MKLMKNLKKKLQKSSKEKGLDVYVHLIKEDNPNLYGRELINKVNKEFGTTYTTGDLYMLDNPTISEMREDLELIYKHNGINI